MKIDNKCADAVMAEIHKQMCQLGITSEHYKGKKLLVNGWYHKYKVSIFLDSPVLPEEHILRFIQHLIHDLYNQWSDVRIEVDETGLVDISFYSTLPLHFSTITETESVTKDNEAANKQEEDSFDVLLKSVIDITSKSQAIIREGGIFTFNLVYAYDTIVNEKMLTRISAYFKTMTGLLVELTPIENGNLLNGRMSKLSHQQAIKEEVSSNYCPKTDETPLSIGAYMASRFIDDLDRIKELSMLGDIATSGGIKEDIKNRIAPLVKNMCIYANNVTNLQEYHTLNSILEVIEYLKQLLSMSLSDRVVLNNCINVLVTKALTLMAK
jgi:hypothetical protein